MVRISRPLAIAAFPAGASLLIFGRWLWQGTGNLWTKVWFHPYGADPDLGWRRTEDGYAWLGLDAVLATAIMAVAIYLVLRFTRSRSGRIAGALKVSAYGSAGASLLVPLLAAVTGMPATGLREVRPTAAIEAPRGGVRASLEDLPAGRYLVVAHRDSAISVQLQAGGEAFDARFGGELEGFWLADPGDLSQPMQAQVSVAAKSIDTGIGLRNQHALGDLRANLFPHIQFSLTAIHSTERSGQKVRFAAGGALSLGDKVHPVEVVGELSKIDEALGKRLGLGDGDYVLLQAGFSVDISQTIVGNDGTFDQDRVPISVTLILKHSETRS